MNKYAEDSLKNYCCTCLSYERNLHQLFRVRDGINMLCWLLSYNSEASKEGIVKNSLSLSICWECKALLGRLSIFRDQARAAQMQLTSVIEAKPVLKPHTMCLSRLSYSYKHTYDKTYNYIIENNENFIDCGLPMEVKTETVEENITALEISSITSNTQRVDLKITGNTERGVDYSNTEGTDYKILDDSTETSIDNKDEKFRVISDTCFDGNEKIVKYKCSSCDFVTQVFKDIVVHTNSHEGIKTSKHKVYICEECNRSFDSYAKRWKHIHKTHRDAHKCATCEKMFPLKSSLLKHIRRHEAKPPRKQCPTCTKMVRVDIWKQHMATHSKREKFSCVECNKTYVCRASYENHLKFTSVHAVRNYYTHKCNSCEKAYRTATELRDHVNYNHIGRTRHKCPICHKPFSTKRCITRHVNRAHNGIKENTRNKICQLCGKAFYTKKSLLEHELIHSGERPLTCEVCGSTFRQKASLYTHKKRVHNIHVKRKTVEAI